MGGDKGECFRRMLWTLFFSVLFLFACAAPAEASVIYVKWDATGVNDGTSWTDAYMDLQDAVAVAGSGDEIWVAAGTYVPVTAIRRRFDLAAGAALYGGFAGSESSRDQRDWENNVTVLSGDFNGDDGPDFTNRDDNAGIVVEADTGCVVDGFAVKNGAACSTFPDTDVKVHAGLEARNADDVTVVNCIFENNLAVATNIVGGGVMGGGLFAENVTDLVVRNCSFIGNRVENSSTWSSSALGGGAYASGPPALFEDCVFENNTAEASDASYSAQGGGLFLVAGIVRRCTFTGNSATGGSAGGGLLGAAEVIDCVFTANRADWGGGLASCANVSGCRFADNHAAWGGGGATGGTEATFADCVFSGNTAMGNPAGGGGGFHGSGALTDCVFDGNNSHDYGGGVGLSGNGILTVDRCFFYGNTAPSGGGAATSNPFGRDNPTMIATSCVFVSNTASYGGGMALGGPDSKVVGCTFVGNLHTLYVGTVEVVNCIIWEDRQRAVLVWGTLDISFCDILGGSDNISTGLSDGTVNLGEGIIDLNPGFADSNDPDGPDDVWGTADDGLRILASSPCVNAGSNAAVPAEATLDAVGAPRIMGGSVDIGAYEFHTNAAPVAVAEASPSSGPAPLDVHLSGLASYDPDGQIESYSWELDGVAISTGAEFDRTFTCAGSVPVTYAVTLIVTDNEGATGSAEVQITVDPAGDTDSDGMPDYWEDQYSAYGFDSATWNDPAADTDSDGLSDLDEYLNGTNPGVADTDGDTMPDGWEVGHGLDPLADDSGLDPDGDTLTNGEEYDLGTDPGSGDTDGDGLDDGWEVQYFDPADPTILNPASDDSDGDGLTDDQEDDDGDGVSNAAEMLAGTDPTDPTSFDVSPGTHSTGGCTPSGREVAPAWLLLAAVLGTAALRLRSLAALTPA